MKIAVLLLCHESPNQIAQRLSSPFYASADVKLYLHYDAQRKDSDFARLQSLVPEGVQCQLLHDRVACAWGEYSLVEATHRLMRSALADPDFQADYLVLISGSCTPLRPLASFQEFLRRPRRHRLHPGRRHQPPQLGCAMDWSTSASITTSRSTITSSAGCSSARPIGNAAWASSGSYRPNCGCTSARSGSA